MSVLLVSPDDIWPQYERQGSEEPEWVAMERDHFLNQRYIDRTVSVCVPFMEGE